MLRRTVVVTVSVAALAAGGCGNSSTTPTTSSSPTTTPTITIVSNPADATAAPSSDPSYQFSTSFALTLTESAGVAVTIRSIGANLQQAAGGIVVTPPTGLSEAFRFQVRAPGNRLEANGTMQIGFSFLYTLPQPGQEALVTVSFTFVDDAGNVYPQTAQVKVV